MQRIFAPLFGLLALSGSPTLAQVMPSEPGFLPAAASFVPFDAANFSPAAYATLLDGSIIAFDGWNYRRLAADGTVVQTYGTLGSFAFPSFVEIDAAQTFALVGESSTQSIVRIELATGAMTTVANVTFNFDAAIAPAGDVAYISAFPVADVEIVELELATGLVRTIATLPGTGASGPVAIDANGWLYYGTQDPEFDFPPDPGTTDIVRWSPAQIALGDRTLADAEVFSPAFDAGSSLAFDPATGQLFLAEPNLNNPANLVHQIGLDGSRVDVVVRTPFSIGNLEIIDTPGDGAFSAYQPDGSRLAYQQSNFGLSQSQRIQIQPLRPSASFDGPGPGMRTLAIQDAEPNSSVIVFVGFASDVETPELTYDLGYVAPFYSALPITGLIRRNIVVPTNALGYGTFTYFEPAPLNGILAFQAVILDEVGLPAGSSTHVLN